MMQTGKKDEQRSENGPKKATEEKRHRVTATSTTHEDVDVKRRPKAVQAQHHVPHKRSAGPQLTSSLTWAREDIPIGRASAGSDKASSPLVITRLTGPVGVRGVVQIVLDILEKEIKDVGPRAGPLQAELFFFLRRGSGDCARIIRAIENTVDDDIGSQPLLLLSILRSYSVSFGVTSTTEINCSSCKQKGSRLMNTDILTLPATEHSSLIDIFTSLDGSKPSTCNLCGNEDVEKSKHFVSSSTKLLFVSLDNVDKQRLKKIQFSESIYPFAGYDWMVTGMITENGSDPYCYLAGKQYLACHEDGVKPLGGGTALPLDQASVLVLRRLLPETEVASHSRYSRRRSNNSDPYWRLE